MICYVVLCDRLSIVMLSTVMLNVLHYRLVCFSYSENTLAYLTNVCVAVVKCLIAQTPFVPLFHLMYLKFFNLK
jgi:hypothetical protein